jgi:hypothetical protein
LDYEVEGVPQRVSFIIAMVVVVGAIFVSICGTLAPRTTVAATDNAIAPITTAGKKWGTTTPSTWSNKTKTKTKTETKSTTLAATSPPLHLKTATLVLPPLLPLDKQRQR